MLLNYNYKILLFIGDFCFYIYFYFFWNNRG